VLGVTLTLLVQSLDLNQLDQGITRLLLFTAENLEHVPPIGGSAADLFQPEDCCRSGDIGGRCLVI
jgi:hypothetical protein